MTKTTTAIHPLPGFLLVKPNRPEEKTSSGIILPKQSTEDQQAGQVLSHGGDYKNEHGIVFSPPCQIDDQIIFKEWGKQKYKYQDQEYYLVKYDDVVAILK